MPATATPPANPAVDPDRDAIDRCRAEQLTTRAMPMRGDSIDEETRSFDVVIATEGRVQVYDCVGRQVIDEVLLIDGLESVPRSVSLLDSHDRWSCANCHGRIENIRPIDENGERLLVGRGRVIEMDTALDPEPERIWQRVRQRAITDMSAGYRVLESVDLRPGETREINGRTFTAGQRVLRIATKWRLREGSLTPIGADERSTIRQETSTMPQPQNRTDGGSGDGLRTADPPANNGPATAPAPAPAPADNQRAIAANQERINGLLNLRGAVPDNLIDDAIRGTTTAADVALAALQQRSADAPAPIPFPTDGAQRHANGIAPAGHVRDHERDCNWRTLEAGLAIRAGCPNRIHASSEAERTNLLTQGDRYRSMSLHQILNEGIRMLGGSGPVWDPEAALRECVRLERMQELTGRSAVSTGSMTALFGNTYNAIALEAFSRFPNTIRGWARKGTLVNFNPAARVRRTATSRLEKLLPGGKPKHDNPGAVRTFIEAYRYSEQFVLDEQHVINDDVNELMSQAEEHSRGAATLESDLGYAMLLRNPIMHDGLPCFHADHGNLTTGSGAALGVEAAKLVIAKLKNQRENGKPLGMTAHAILTPIELAWLARELFWGDEKRDNGASDGYSTKNALYGEMKGRVEETRLGTLGVWDPDTEEQVAGDDDQWFIVSEPTTVKVELSHVQGKDTPTSDVSLITDGGYGYRFRTKFDVGFAIHDYRGMQMANPNLSP